MTLSEIHFNAQHGRFGIEIISDTALHTVNLLGFLATSDTVIASATGLLKTGNAITSVTIPAGQYFPLPGCTALTLTSGAGIGIKAPATTIPIA